MAGFDWNVLAECEYGVSAPWHPEGVVDCNAPACYRVWWADDTGKFMLLCAEHFEIVKAQEEA